MENASSLLFYFSKELNIWKCAKHLFEASDTDSPGRQNIDELLSSVTSTTWLLSRGLWVRLSVSLYGTIAVHSVAIILCLDWFDSWEEHLCLS